MLASDVDIEWVLKQGYLQVTPTEPDLIQPASIDLRLDNRFRAYAPLPAPELILDTTPARPLPIIDPGRDQADLMVDYEAPEGGAYILGPRAFALASTLETIKVGGSFAAKLEGKSSLGRLGLLVHATAGWIDPGFAGHITLELFNATPHAIRLWPGMKIAQLAIMSLHTPARRPYGSAELGSHYQDQPRGPQGSQGWRNFRIWPTRQEEKTHA